MTDLTPATDQAWVEIGLSDQPIHLPALRESLPKLADCGGYVCFEGIVRDHNHGRKVLRLDYEAYDILAEKELRRISEQALERFGLRFVRAIHRQGNLQIGDTAVVIQVLSRHRREAFDGCRFVIDQIKSRVPIWKREHYDDGTSLWTRCHDHGPDTFGSDQNY